MLRHSGECKGILFCVRVYPNKVYFDVLGYNVVFRSCTVLVFLKIFFMS